MLFTSLRLDLLVSTQYAFWQTEGKFSSILEDIENLTSLGEEVVLEKCQVKYFTFI